MKIGIITAMPEETRAVLRKAEQVAESRHDDQKAFRCRIAGHDITLCEAGMGMLNAGKAATSLAAATPDLMVSAGFGGGVLPGLVVGDVVMAERLMILTGAGFDQVEVSFFGQESGDSPSLLLRGCFITSDGILNKQRLKELLPGGINRPVVEMESAAVARIAAEHGIQFLGLRAISDPWDEELDFTIDEFCGDDMRIRPLKVLATILRRPRIIPQLIRLGRNSRVAAKNLGRAVEQLLFQL
jgi:adenosylhomocysteine nucleosidase